MGKAEGMTGKVKTRHTSVEKWTHNHKWRDGGTYGQTEHRQAYEVTTQPERGRPEGRGGREHGVQRRAGVRTGSGSAGAGPWAFLPLANRCHESPPQAIS